MSRLLTKIKPNERTKVFVNRREKDELLFEHWFREREYYSTEYLIDAMRRVQRDSCVTDRIGFDPSFRHIVSDRIREYVNTREHVLNKLERKKIRQESAKLKKRVNVK